VCAPAAPTHADNVTFEFWKAAMTIEVQVPGPGGAILKRKLKTNDVINLALGRPLTTKPDSSTIAIAGTGKHGGSGSLSVSSTAMSGPVSFHAGGTLVSGLMLKGKFKTGGASLGASF